MKERLCIILAKMALSIVVLFVCLGLFGYIAKGVLRVANGIAKVANDYIDQCAEEEKSYQKGEKTITNTLGESYTINYREYTGFPDQLMAIDISNDRKLIHLDCEMKNSLVPDEIVYLFSDNFIEYYYAAGDHSEYKGKHESQYSRPFNFFFAANSIFEKGDDIFFDERPKLTEYSYNKNLELAQMLRRNITRTELVEKFHACGYDDTFVLKVYDYK